jgi:hypothetical protein
MAGESNAAELRLLRDNRLDRARKGSPALQRIDDVPRRRALQRPKLLRRGARDAAPKLDERRIVDHRLEHLRTAEPLTACSPDSEHRKARLASNGTRICMNQDKPIRLDGLVPSTKRRQAEDL